MGLPFGSQSAKTFYSFVMYGHLTMQHRWAEVLAAINLIPATIWPGLDPRKIKFPHAEAALIAARSNEGFVVEMGHAGLLLKSLGSPSWFFNSSKSVQRQPPCPAATTTLTGL
jgi:hypothetical protein